jgi:hypothetical protein
MQNEGMGAWARWPADLTGALAEVGGSAERTAALAALLGERESAAVGAACHLGEGDTAACGALGAEDLAGLTVPAGKVGRVVLGQGAEPLMGLVAPFPTPGGQGWLLLAVPRATPEADLGRIAAFLALAADAVGLRLELAHLTETLHESADLLIVGEAMGGVVHGINNHLNSMVLQAACAQLKAGEGLKGELDLVRREGLQAAVRLRPLQQVRAVRRGAARVPCDLASAVREVLARHGDLAPQVNLSAEEAPVEVNSCAFPLRRLVWLLLRVALGLPGRAGGPVRLRVCRASSEPHLEAEIDGPELPSGVAALDEWQLQGQGGVPELERTALSSLARCLEARLKVQGWPGGVTLAITWPVKDRG